MKLKLRELADVQIGYQHRDAVHHDASGSHRLIQVKDVESGGKHDEQFPEPAAWRIWAGDLEHITPRADAGRYLLETGDLLFVSRGPNNVAIPLVRASFQPFPERWENVIAAYTFYIVRPDRSRVLPEYLAWVINQPTAQMYLTAQARGTVAKLLPKGAFEELEIPLPPLAVQHQIVELERLRAKEEQLLRQLIAARQRLMQQACHEVIQRDQVAESHPDQQEPSRGRQD